TWLYDVATQQASLLSDGNVNDQCHTFSANDDAIYVCREYDFTFCFNEKGYRIGRIDLPGGNFTFLTPDAPNDLALYPQPNAGSTQMFFQEITFAGGQQHDDIATQPLPMGTSTMVRADAGTPVLSPDGARYAFADYTDMGRLHVSKLD